MPKSNLTLIATVSQEWLVDEGYASAMESAISSMTVRDVIKAQRATTEMEARTGGGSGQADKGYMVQNGIAYVTIAGPMTKNPHCMQMYFGGTATKVVEAAMWAAADDADVKSIMVYINSSPGGDVQGSFDLANAIHQINTTKKPVDAHIEDMGASAAYLVASQARHVSGNVNALVGSIGVYTQLVDTTKADEAAGVRRVTVYAGKYKAIGAPGRPLSAEDIAHVQARVDGTMGLFTEFVARGRGMDEKALAKVANGAVFMGKEAMRLGLIDKVESLGSAHKRAMNSPASPGGMRGEDNMAKLPFNMNAFRALLNVGQSAEDAGEGDQAGELATEPTEATVAEVPVTAEAGTGQAAQSVTADMPTVLLDALKAAGADSVEGLSALVARAKVGDDYTARLREQVGALCVLAFDQEHASLYDDMIANASVEMLRGQGRSFEALAVQKGLLNEDGSPKQRESAAVGDATDDSGSADISENGQDRAGATAAARTQLQSTGLYSL